MGKYTYWKEMIHEDWIKNGITDEEPIRWAEEFGIYLARKGDEAKYANGEIKKRKTKNGEKPITRNPLTTSQLRKFFGEVKRLQLLDYKKAKSDILLLKPKLAYAVGRAKDEDAKIHDFYEVITDALSYVQDQKSFENFINLFEAIVAFHKAAEDSGLVTDNSLTH